MTGLTYFYFLAGCVALVSCQSPDSKLAILQGDDGEGFHAFRVEDGQLMQLTSESGTWSLVAPCPGGKIVSNPVSQRTTGWGSVFILAENGQVYYGQDMGKGLSKWTQVAASTMLPRDANATTDINALTIVRNGDRVLVFAKTTEVHPRLFWTFANATLARPVFSAWKAINNGQPLHSAASAAVNYFTHYVEVVAIMTDGKVYHSWQTSATEFHDWKDFSSIFWSHFPDRDATPILRANSGKSFFNGRLELFLYGQDGYIHHLGQTTCDRVMNPWSECTWGLYERLDDHAVPTPLSVRSPLVAGSNAHGGIELFTIDKSSRFWHMWQVEEGKKFNTWTLVDTPVAAHSVPTIYQDQTGYWAGYLMDASMKVHRVTQKKSMELKPTATSVPSGTNITVSWTVPVDEAMNTDWIGVYLDGDRDDKYVDFRYVQGAQNPLHNAVPNGSVVIHSVLNNNAFQYRYMVNRTYYMVMEQGISFTDYTTASEGTQLYRGLAVGLGQEAGFFDTCVEDSNHTVSVFRQAFIDFEDRKVIQGLQLLGVGLKDVVTALEACEQTDIAKQVMRFVKDLIACTHEDCAHFIIDVVGEIVSVFYENVHEIYGDIRGAKNCFPYKLYEQGGINIGRVVAAVIEGPRV